MTASPFAHPVTARVPARSLLESPGLPWLLIAVGLVSAFGRAAAEALQGLRLPDTDDAMRLVQVRDWLAGQPWYDLVQHRFLPPTGVASHWSRLVDLPLAGGIAGLTPLLGGPAAEWVTTALWPLVLFGLYAAILVAGTGALFGRRVAVFSLFCATQTSGLTIQFMPGRIDHHGVQIVLMLGLLCCLVRSRPAGWRAAVAAGALCALSLAVGLEALPLIALAGLVVVADWVGGGRAAQPALVGFAASLSLAALALFGLQTAPALWSRTACDALSPPWLWLAGTGAALAAAAVISRPSRPRARLAVTACVGALGLVGFAALFPACPHGPYPDMPGDVRANWLDRVYEMQPIWILVPARPAEGLGFAAALFVATPVAFVLALRDRVHRRAFVVTGLFLAAGSLLTVFQMRGVYVASAFVPLVAGFCLDRAFAAARPEYGSVPARIAVVALALALNAHLWLGLGQGIQRAGLGGAAPPASPVDACAGGAELAALDALPAGTVLAPIDLGSDLLLHTHHAIAAAPYHRATAGLRAGLALSGGDEAALRAQAGAVAARYLALCPVRADAAAGGSFAARLASGQAAAGWLEPVDVPGSGLKVWRLR